MLHHARLPKLISSTHEKLTLRNKQRTDKGNRLYLRIRGQRRRERPTNDNKNKNARPTLSWSLTITVSLRFFPGESAVE
jgi:hypothetical protein